MEKKNGFVDLVAELGLRIGYEPGRARVGRTRVPSEAADRFRANLLDRSSPPADFQGKINLTEEFHLYPIAPNYFG